jgi:membrane-associated protease RseP (regulator of RpoE activity)
VGANHYAGFLGSAAATLGTWDLIRHGLYYSAAVLGILLAHEMGHYVACRYYRIDASLPYFLPAPLLAGTLGAFIRIRQPIQNKRELFDVGIAGPIAGFLVAIPVLFIGVSLSTLFKVPANGEGIIFGEPLLLKAVIWLVWGTRDQGIDLNIHPVAIAGWFGLLATLLNLFPFGQLDGGHITYATLGRLSTPISIATVGVAIVMTLVTTSWMFMTLMMLAMLFFLGPRHPSVINEYEPLSRGRVTVALVALAVLVVCFTPVPIEPYDLIRNP